MDFSTDVGNILKPATCPEDVSLLTMKGVTPFPDRAVDIISQDSSSVTVKLNQLWGKKGTRMSSVYYQYREETTIRGGTTTQRECHEDTNVMAGSTIGGGEITIQCEASSPVAILNVCAVDGTSGILQPALEGGDDATIPKCCRSNESDGSSYSWTDSIYVAKVCYSVQINCKSACDGGHGNAGDISRRQRMLRGSGK